MATIVDIDFNGGGTLASLGFTNIIDAANVAGAGPDASFAMSWQASNDLAEARLAIDMLGQRALCHTGVWIPKVETDWSIALFRIFTGGVFSGKVFFETVSGTKKLQLRSAPFTIHWTSANNAYVLDTPLYWKLYVKGSTWNVGAADWDLDGEISLWLGSSAGSLVLQTALTGLYIEASAVGDASYPSAFDQIIYGPQGILDDLFCTNSTCAVAVAPDLPVDESAQCCASDAVEGSGVAPPGAGVDRDLVVDPTWIPRLAGGAQGPSEPDLTDPEDWGDS